MIETYIRDHRQDRCQHIRAVQTTSQAHFNHGDIYFLTHKIIERHDRHGLKKRGLQFIQQLFVLLHKCRYLLFRNRLSVDTNAFGQTDQMRTGE